MLSVADVPVAGVHFRSVIGVVLWKGGKYRLATYLGGKSGTGSECESSNYSRRFRVRSKIAGGSQAPS